MMFRIFRVSVDFPALDRLVTYLEAAQQKEIDAMAAQVRDLTAQLSQHRATLEEAAGIPKEK